VLEKRKRLFERLITIKAFVGLRCSEWHNFVYFGTYSNYCSSYFLDLCQRNRYGWWSVMF